MRVLSWIVLAALGVAGCGRGRAQEQTIKVGIARSTSNAAELMALKHGYFKEAGIKLEWDDIDTTANVIALLAQNQYQIVAGGISAGIFNALEKNLPITILSDRVSTPIGHNLMLRPDLKDTVKSLKDLKGKSSPATGRARSRPTRSARCWSAKASRINDVDLKIFPFTQMGIALQEQGDRCGLLIPPFTWQLEEQGLAIPFAERRRSGAAAADDDRRHHGQHRLGEGQPGAGAELHDGVAARRARLLPSLSRRARTARRSSTSWSTARPSRAGNLLDKYPWPARSPNGKINVASMLDINDWYVENKMSAQKFPAERLVDSSYIDYADQQARAVRAAEQGQQAAGLPLSEARIRAGEG